MSSPAHYTARKTRAHMAKSAPSAREPSEPKNLHPVEPHNGELDGGEDSEVFGVPGRFDPSPDVRSMSSRSARFDERSLFCVNNGRRPSPSIRRHPPFPPRLAGEG